MAHAEEFLLDTGGDTADGIAGAYVEPERSHTAYGLPNHAEGQSVHVGTYKERIGTFPGHDYMRTIRDSAQARRYEWLYVELREGGRVSGPPKIVHIRPRVETVELAGRARGRGRHYYREEMTPNAARRRPRRDGLGADTLIRELISTQQQAAQAALERERLHNEELRRVEQERNAELRRLEKEANEERFRRMEAQIAAAGQSEPKEEAGGGGILDTLLSKVLVKKVEEGDEDVTDRLISRVVGGDEEENPRGVLGSVIGFAREIAGAVREDPDGVKEILGMTLALVRPGLVMQQQQQAAQQQARAAPPPRPQPPPPSVPAQEEGEAVQLSAEAQAALSGATTTLLQDMAANAEPGRTVQALLVLTDRHAELEPVVRNFVASTPSVVLAQLVGQLSAVGAGYAVPYCSLPHSEQFIASVQSELRRERRARRHARERAGGEGVGSPSNNGDAAAVAVAQREG